MGRVRGHQRSWNQRITATGSVPYAGFAIFGLFGLRMVKKVKLSGVMLGGAGAVKAQKIYGPCNIALWLSIRSTSGFIMS